MVTGSPGEGVVDCGIHAIVAGIVTLTPYLSAEWREHLASRAPRGAAISRGRGSADGISTADVRGEAVSRSRDAHGAPSIDDRGDANVSAVRRQVFDEFGVSRGILIATTAFGRQTNIELDAAIASAMNDWQVERWLDPEPRLRGSIAIPFEEADLAVAEIKRRANDPRFAQVQIVGRSRAPLGNAKYWPIYEAAANAGLPIAIHPAGDGDYPATGAGWPSFDLEERIVPSCAMQANLISLVCGGVFQRIPGLRVLCSGTGFAWAPPLTWRLDASWRLLRDEIPDVTRPPSEYIQERVWWTTQPMIEPRGREYVLALFDQFAFDDRVVFASGYPGPDFDTLDSVFALELPATIRNRIARANAIDLYGGRL